MRDIVSIAKDPTRRVSGKLSRLATLAVLTLTWACSGDDGVVGDPTGLEGEEASLILKAVLPPEANIEGLVIEVTAPDLAAPLVFNIPIDPSTGEASGILTVPTGSDRTVLGRAYDASGILTHEGLAVTEVRPGRTNLDLRLLPIEGDLFIDLSIGSFTVAVTPEVSSLLQGLTLGMDVTVTDPDGNPVDREVRWASTNPVLASVNEDGLVTGKLPGEVSIVATVGDAAASARIVVVESVQTAYVTLGGGGISMIDIGTNTVTGTIAAPGLPWGIAILPDHSRGYVADYTGNRVLVVDLVTNTVGAAVPVGSRPIDVAITPDGSTVYVTNNAGASVSVIDVATNTVTGTITTPPEPRGIAILPDGSKGYAASYGSGRVSVIDLATNTLSGNTPVGDGPIDVAVTPDGSAAYVTNFYGNSVSVINVATNTVVGGIAMPAYPWGIAILPDGSRGYVSTRSGFVSVIDLATNTVRASIPVGSEAASVASTPDGSAVYVTNLYGNSVSVIDVATNTVTATVPTGGDPRGIAIAVRASAR